MLFCSFGFISANFCYKRALDPKTPKLDDKTPLMFNDSFSSLVSVYLFYFKPINEVLNEFDEISPVF
jgi:hypothetical protein